MPKIQSRHDTVRDAAKSCGFVFLSTNNRGMGLRINGVSSDVSTHKRGRLTHKRGTYASKPLIKQDLETTLYLPVASSYMKTCSSSLIGVEIQSHDPTQRREPPLPRGKPEVGRLAREFRYVGG